MFFDQRDILVIDDSPGIRTFLNVSFGGVGARIHEAPTADMGIKLFETVKPDVVILDLGLPDKDGLDLLPALRAMHHNKNITIIVLTVRNDTYTRNKAIEFGANGYVTKPFMMEELYECLNESVKN
ncbi:MAG: response regulator [Alphaproteobacteria bacterium]|nr:response regulator [Alphaproteobacteria bacterium]